MDNEKKQSKLSELLSCGYEFTGRTYKIRLGENKGKEFPIYAQIGDIAALVYNDEADKIEMCFQMPLVYTGKQPKPRAVIKEIKKPGAE